MGPGLRERKKQRTREAIVRAACELVLEVGYDAATIQRIAERADVAPRTIHTIFPSKDAILTSTRDEPLVRLQAALAAGAPASGEDHAARTRPEASRDAPGRGVGDVVDRILDWLAHEADRKMVHLGIDELHDRIYLTDPHLRAIEYGQRQQIEREVAAAAAADRGEDPSAPSIISAAFGGAVGGILAAARDRHAAGEQLDIGELADAIRAARALLRS